MKILIAGAPKTGNMWLKNMLSHVYELPQVDLSGVPDFRAHLDANFPEFVTHQHFIPKPYILAWGERVGAKFITLTRHPGDLFVSLYFYVNQYGEAWRQAGNFGQTPSHQMIGQSIESKPVMDYLEHDFHAECLGKTIAWHDAGVASLVRYEDLKQQPEATLATLVQNLAPVARSQLINAVRKSQFKAMRKQAGPEMKAHFRRGKSGGWRRWLNQRHCDIIADVSKDAMARYQYDFAEKRPRSFLRRWL